MTVILKRHLSPSIVAITTSLVGLVLPCASLAAAAVEARAGAAVNLVNTPLKVQPLAELSFGFVASQTTGLTAEGGASGVVVLTSAPPTQRASANVILGPNGGETPLIRKVTGDAGRSYRVTVPSVAYTSVGGLSVRRFTLWSQTAGDITKTGIGVLDNTGADLLRIGATLTVPSGTPNAIYSSSVPITVAYE